LEFLTRVGKNHDFYQKIKKSDFLKFKPIINLKIRIFVPTFYQIFETGLSAQSHKQHSRHNLLFPVVLLLRKK